MHGCRERTTHQNTIIIGDDKRGVMMFLAMLLARRRDEQRADAQALNLGAELLLRVRVSRNAFKAPLASGKYNIGTDRNGGKRQKSGGLVPPPQYHSL